MRGDLHRWLVGVLAAIGLLALVPSAPAGEKALATRPTALGTGGAAASVDGTATRAAVQALRQGANAVDAAVVAAGVLGVTEPYSCGIGGGGFMVVYRPQTGRVTTIDSRETAPAAFGSRSFLDAAGRPIPLPEAITSGLSTGVPGTVRGWDEALDRYGTLSLREALQPAIRVARKGFVVDETFRSATAGNAARFAAFPATRTLYLPGGQPPAPGTVLRNPDLAATYQLIGRLGVKGFYEGALARDIVATVRRPPVDAASTLNVRPGVMDAGDLDDYEARLRRATRVGYRGLDVYGMAPPSSGGSTVGEALNILEGFDLRGGGLEAAAHRYLEASRLAYADRGAYLGDPEFVDVPLSGLLSDAFAAARRALIGERAGTSPVPPGDPFAFQDDPSPSGPRVGAAAVRTGSTTHLTVSDRDGTVVSYTFTIEQTGGNGIVVPGRGFLLNNELTDFEFTPPAANAAEPGKRPRSSMAPTIVLRDGKPFLALGSPGGATIVTTVLQVLLNRVDGGVSLPEAIAAPRASQRNAASTQAEPGFLVLPLTAGLRARGHTFTVGTDPEIGAATGIELLPGGGVLAAAEPVRRGSGAAAVERPAGR